MINTYIKSVGWCPVHKMDVVILVDRKKTKWLPIFIKPKEADILESLLAGEAIQTPRTEGEIRRISLATDRVNSYYAIVEIKKRSRLFKKKMHYATAIIIAAKLKKPIRIPEEKMLDVRSYTSETMVRREDVRISLKDRLDRRTKPKSALEQLKIQLQDAIENEEYEEAEIISKEIEILKDKYSQ